MDVVERDYLGPGPGALSIRREPVDVSARPPVTLRLLVVAAFRKGRTELFPEFP